MALTSDDTSRHRRRLGSLVTQRRAALGITDKRVAAKRCNMSVTTYTKIENGDPVNPLSYAKLEQGFGMVAGSCGAVLDGAESIMLLDGGELFVAGRSVAVDRSQLEPTLREAITKWTRLVRPDITLGEDQAMTDGILEELRRRGLLPDSEK
ncbi:helix-turn-helix transcriptional regulator [Streptomyces sp.]|uniref:helix-turn-helix transcriptional regulator n=1 Tax=Streptomyces sp. TaxID=1931 RepID=UPI002D37C4DA|nr:helix-turn-helix transcriptional regulator [Streptomyces sp.]HZF92017.1 helix-turn-helix transcriptional regulator [Streptomyces sp.]